MARLGNAYNENKTFADAKAILQKVLDMPNRNPSVKAVATQEMSRADRGPQKRQVAKRCEKHLRDTGTADCLWCTRNERGSALPAALQAGQAMACSEELKLASL